MYLKKSKKEIKEKKINKKIRKNTLKGKITDHHNTAIFILIWIAFTKSKCDFSLYRIITISHRVPLYIEKEAAQERL